MENEKFLLRQQTLRRYILAMARRGASGIVTDPGCRKRYLVMVAIITLACIALCPRVGAAAPLLGGIYTMLWLIGCLAAVPACGYIPGSWAMYDDLTRAGVVNYAGEAPLLIARHAYDNNVLRLTFFVKGYPLDRWQVDQALIESALNVCILSMQQGVDNQTIVLDAVPATNALQDVVPWQDNFLPTAPSQLCLGVNAAGVPVSIDLTKVPHWLLGAATGCGKTQLLLLLLHQFHLHHFDVYLADYKGVDYPTEYQTGGHYATDNAQLLAMLNVVFGELVRRRNLFAASHCSHLDVYNSSHDVKLQRIAVILDETSMILDSTGRDKDEKSEIAAITGHLLTIGRLGRAMGIHLIVATQRPDVASVPGPLKAQLDGRICGHCADAQSSIVILDDGSGAKLPAVPGRFIIRDGSGVDKIVQAYFLERSEQYDV